MIVSSRIVSKDRQIDGRFSVREEHTDDAGNVFNFDYMCDSAFDCEARLAEHAAGILPVEVAQ